MIFPLAIVIVLSLVNADAGIESHGMIIAHSNSTGNSTSQVVLPPPTTTMTPPPPSPVSSIPPPPPTPSSTIPPPTSTMPPPVSSSMPPMTTTTTTTTSMQSIPVTTVTDNNNGGGGRAQPSTVVDPISVPTVTVDSWPAGVPYPTNTIIVINGVLQNTVASATSTGSVQPTLRPRFVGAGVKNVDGGHWMSKVLAAVAIVLAI